MWAEAFANSFSASFAALTEVSIVKLSLWVVSRMCTKGATTFNTSVCSFANVLSASFVSLPTLPYTTQSSFRHLVVSTFGTLIGFFRLCLAAFVRGLPKQDCRKVDVLSDTGTKLVAASPSSSGHWIGGMVSIGSFNGTSAQLHPVRDEEAKAFGTRRSLCSGQWALPSSARGHVVFSPGSAWVLAEAAVWLHPARSPHSSANQAHLARMRGESRSCRLQT